MNILLRVFLMLYVTVFSSFGFGQTTLVSESFESATFPPTGWVNLNGGTGNVFTRANTVTAQQGSWFASYVFNSTNAANAWLISPGVSMIAGVTYNIKYFQRVNNASYPERMKVTIGSSNTIAAQTTTLQDFSSLTNTSWTDRSFTYTPSASGTYYIGWNCYSAADQSRLFIDNVQIIEPVISAPTTTLSNYAAVSTSSTAFANRIGSLDKPKFTLSANLVFNAAQIEINTKSDFTGTALVSTFSSGAAASTLRDFVTTHALTSGRTYFVRARTSSNAGSTWGAWTSALWPYSYYSSTPYAEEGWYYTAGEQFLTGVTQESSYNFINVSSDATLPDNGNFRLNQGAFSINSGTGDGVKENGDWYPSETYMTMGWQNDCNGNAAIYNGFPFTVNIPQAALINAADFSVVASTACVCETQNVSMRLIFDGGNLDNAANPTTTTVSTITSRTTANQTILYNTAWTNGTRYTLTSVTNILQEVINRAGWSAGNNFNLFARWNTAFTAGSNNNRCLRQTENGATTAPLIEGTFTNYKNTVYFPAVNRNIYGPAGTSWDELKVTDNTTACASCYIEYRIHNAAGGAVLAGPFTRAAGLSGSHTMNIAGVSTQNIFVSATIYRSNDSPVIHDLWLTTNTPSPLPVELSAFNVHCEEGANVDVKWSTASEVNSSHFIIQKSKDLVSWEDAGKVQAHGNSSSVRNYKFSDPEISRDVVYYRLKQHDLNGIQKEYPPLSVVCKSTEFNVSVFPNPSYGPFMITIESDEYLEGAQIILYDLNGRLLSERITEIEKGTSILSINDLELSTGAYLLKVVHNQKKSEVIRFFIE